MGPQPTTYTPSWVTFDPDQTEAPTTTMSSETPTSTSTTTIVVTVPAETTGSGDGGFSPYPQDKDFNETVAILVLAAVILLALIGFAFLILVIWGRARGACPGCSHRDDQIKKLEAKARGQNLRNLVVGRNGVREAEVDLETDCEPCRVRRTEAVPPDTEGIPLQNLPQRPQAARTRDFGPAPARAGPSGKPARLTKPLPSVPAGGSNSRDTGRDAPTGDPPQPTSSGSGQVKNPTTSRIPGGNYAFSDVSSLSD